MDWNGLECDGKDKKNEPPKKFIKINSLIINILNNTELSDVSVRIGVD